MPEEVIQEERLVGRSVAVSRKTGRRGRYGLRSSCCFKGRNRSTNIDSVGAFVVSTQVERVEVVEDKPQWTDDASTASTHFADR